MTSMIIGQKRSGASIHMKWAAPSMTSNCAMRRARMISSAAAPV